MPNAATSPILMAAADARATSNAANRGRLVVFTTMLRSFCLDLVGSG